MLTQPIFEKLTRLRLSGFRDALKDQMASTQYGDLGFEERLGLLLDYEMTLREERRLKRRLTNARFRERASIPDLDLSHSRGLDKSLILSLATCTWVKEHLNIIITGATGVGKTYLSNALGHAACEQGFTVKYFKTSRLLDEMEQSHADGSWGIMLDRIAKIQLIIVDDWLRDPITKPQTRTLLEIFDDRWKQASIILISQLPVEDWHQRIPEPTLADAILDRIIHNSYRIEMKGESQRKLKTNKPSVS